jgi:ABC-type multidrug transport system fused ATPase/permease subunit
MDKIIEVAKLANAYEFVISFENGFDTVVGERGIRLSGKIIFECLMIFLKMIKLI